MFTYHSDAPDTDLDRLRLHIGDTVEDEGPRVGGRNYSDGELGLRLAQAGSWAGAVTLALHALANAATTAAINVKGGAFQTEEHRRCRGVAPTRGGMGGRARGRRQSRRGDRWDDCL